MIKLNLEQYTAIKEFINESQDCTAEVLLCSGNYRVDGKSILGVFSLDLSKPVNLICEDENDYPRFSKWFAKETTE